MIRILMWGWIVSGLCFVGWYYKPYLARRFVVRLGWIVLDWYTTWKEYVEKYNRNHHDISQTDGYHVDYVHLYENGKRYDVTSLFREGILKKEYHDYSIAHFLTECDHRFNNFTYSKINDYVLEVRYTFDFNKYRVYFDTELNPSITFPLYTEESIRQDDREEFLSAIIEERDNAHDVTKVINRLSGPRYNFYKDCGMKIKSDWLMGNFWKYPIHVIDCEGNDYELKPFIDIQ